jgi:hypothetical protein
MADEAKILVTALVSSFCASLFTVGVTEPARGWFQRRRVRRWLYREMIQNCSVLLGWVESVKRNPPEVHMLEQTTAQFRSEYRRLAFDLAIKGGRLLLLA